MIVVKKRMVYLHYSESEVTPLEEQLESLLDQIGQGLQGIEFPFILCAEGVRIQR